MEDINFEEAVGDDRLTEKEKAIVLVNDLWGLFLLGETCLPDAERLGIVTEREVAKLEAAKFLIEDCYSEIADRYTLGPIDEEYEAVLDKLDQDGEVSS